MQIRASTLADLAAVDALLARVYPRLLKADYPPSVLVTALPLISRAQPALLRCGTHYVVEEEGRILGAGGWTPDAADGARAHIRHLVVDDREQRRGIARRIVTRCAAQARAGGAAVLECWSTRTAVPFYAALGFETCGPLIVPLRAGIVFPSVRMIRAL